MRTVQRCVRFILVALFAAWFLLILTRLAYPEMDATASEPNPSVPIRLLWGKVELANVVGVGVWFLALLIAWQDARRKK